MRTNPLALLVLAATSASSHAGDAPGLFETSWLGFDTGVYADPDSAWYPDAMTVADFNGDGLPDVATANTGNFLPTAQRVSVILNQGDGTYGAPSAYFVADPPKDIVSADFDGDGSVDLMVPNTGNFNDGTTVSLLRNLGGGTFGEAVEFASGGPGSLGITAADFDADGDIDVVTANFGWHGAGTTVSLLENAGNGSFAAPVLYDAGASPYQVEAGDFNGDGLPDLVVATSKEGLRQFTVIRVLMNNGAGFDAPFELTSMYTGGDFSPCVDVTDMDRDGDADIVYSDLKLHEGDNWNTLYAAAVYRNQGAGTFAAPEKIALGANTGGFSSIAAADFNQDGWPDIVGTHEANAGWSIIPSDGVGGFGTYTELISAEYPTAIAPADADGDGDLEVLVGARFSMEVTVHFNPGNGDFSPPAMYHVIGGSYHFDAADIDLDGDLDIAASRGYASNGSISILENLGDGSFGPYTEYTTPVFASSVKLRNLNGDAYPDLLWADKYPPYSFRSKLNNGDGTFGPTQNWLQTFTCGISINNDAIQAFDLDHDGDLDVVLSENLGCGGGAAPKRLFIHANDGNGQFTLVNIVDMNWPPMEILSADVNGDGNPDLITAGYSIDVLLGHGDLTFDPPVTYGSVADAATNATLGDFNGDGAHDVAITIMSGGGVYASLGIMSGHGDGTFDAPVRYRGTYSPNLVEHTAITAADPDGDGDADVLIGNYAANDISLFENNGDGTFRPQVHFGAGNSTKDVFYGDFTGDGINDVAAMVNSALSVSGDTRIAIVPGRVNGAPSVPGDVDGDGDVDFTDLVALLAAWGPCAGDCAADFDGNGVVDFSDLLALLSNWT